MNGVDDGYKRPELSQGFFEIESIKRKRCKKGEAQYLVKWAGWPESANTWEPLENLMSCLDAVDAFENERTRLEAEKQRKKLQKGKRAVTHEQQHQDSPVAVARVTKEPLANPSSNGVRFVDRNSLMYVLRFQMMNAKERRKHTLGMKPWLCPPRT